MDSDDLARETGRLEAALDRIADLALRTRGQPAAETVTSHVSDPTVGSALGNAGAIYDRLDALIARVRAVLDEGDEI